MSLRRGTVVALLLATIGCGGEDGSTPAPARSFAMGCVAVPRQPLSTDAWIEAFDLLHDNAEFVLHHAAVDWADYAAGIPTSMTPNLQSLDFISQMAAARSVRRFFVVDPLASDRLNVDPNLPAAVGSSFADPAVRSAFRNFALRIARDYAPDILGLGSEINTYCGAHPEDRASLLSLCRETYDAVKAISPSIVITSTLQYEELSMTADWGIIDEFDGRLDRLAITTYPSPWHVDPDAMPADTYSRILAHSTLPVIIAESGWPSGGDPAFHGSPANQERFLSRLVELTAMLDLRLWIWWFLHDWEGGGLPGFFTTMGLRSVAGAPKPAWSRWQAIQSL